MAIQDKYISAYYPRYDVRVQIKSAFLSKHGDWLFNCVFEENGNWVHTTFAERELIDFKEKEQCRPRMT